MKKQIKPDDLDKIIFRLVRDDYLAGGRVLENEEGGLFFTYDYLRKKEEKIKQLLASLKDKYEISSKKIAEQEYELGFENGRDVEKRLAAEIKSQLIKEIEDIVDDWGDTFMYDKIVNTQKTGLTYINDLKEKLKTLLKT